MAEATKRAGRQARADSQARSERIHRNWADRHKARAKDERALRMRQQEIAREFDHANVSGTPETEAHAARTHQGSLARLYLAGDLTADQLAWGAEIAATYERICRGIGVRTVSMETRIDTSRAHGGTFFEALGAVRAEVAYTRWRAALRSPALVLAMIVEDRGIAAVARANGMRNATAKALLRFALDEWGVMIRAACDEVDQDALVAAHAAILR